MKYYYASKFYCYIRKYLIFLFLNKNKMLCYINMVNMDLTEKIVQLFFENYNRRVRL